MPTWKGIVGEGYSATDFSIYVNGLTFDAWKPQFVVLHNTYSPTFAQWHNVPGKQRMGNLESYYRDVQHWSAGPHLFIADDLIWVFTPLTTSGVHSPSWNRISWGVELVGDYSTESMGSGLRANAISALTDLHRIGSLDPESLRFHKQDPLTTHKDCPGSSVIKPDFITEIAQGLAADEPGEHNPHAFIGMAPISA